MLSDAFDHTLLSRIEDAGINASAPPQQRWLDGWLVRFSPGKAKRARCIQAVAAGRMPVGEKIAQAHAIYQAAGLPLFVRITPFSLPLGLDTELAAMGMHRIDDTRVMVCSLDALTPSAERRIPDEDIHPVDTQTFAETVGTLRGSTLAQRTAQAQRLASSPVPCSGHVAKDEAGEAHACAQYILEGDVAGLYDVFTRPSARGRGVASALCANLLLKAKAAGARTAYLQVESDNEAARKVYRRLGFVDAYSYHYRSPMPDAT